MAADPLESFAGDKAGNNDRDTVLLAMAAGQERGPGADEVMLGIRPRGIGCSPPR